MQCSCSVAPHTLPPPPLARTQVTYADLIQLAGAASIEAAGGPSVAVAPGRKDSKVGDDGRLTD